MLHTLQTMCAVSPVVTHNIQQHGFSTWIAFMWGQDGHASGRGMDLYLELKPRIQAEKRTGKMQIEDESKSLWIIAANLGTN